MSNQIDPIQNADTVGEMAHCLLIRGAAATASLIAAKKAFDAGDVEHAKLVVNNAVVAVSGPGYTDLDALVYECLYRGPGEAPSGA